MGGPEPWCWNPAAGIRITDTFRPEKEHAGCCAAARRKKEERMTRLWRSTTHEKNKKAGCAIGESFGTVIVDILFTRREEEEKEQVNIKIIKIDDL